MRHIKVIVPKFHEYPLIVSRCFYVIYILIRNGLLTEIKSIYQGGGNGSIIGRNSFQRPKNQAINLLNRIIDIYKGK